MKAKEEEEGKTDQEDLCKRWHARYWKYFIGRAVSSLI
jgi:hypothetical protein